MRWAVNQGIRYREEEGPLNFTVNEVTGNAGKKKLIDFGCRSS